MTTLERSIIINAPQDKVDAIALDATRMPEWYVGLEKAEPDGTYPEVGGVISTVYKAVGLSFNIKMISKEFARGEKITLEMEGMITGTSAWVYSPAPDGVQVNCTFTYEMPGGGLGQIANKLVVEKMNADNLEKSLTNLKAVVEGS